ncbi:MAG: IS1634 family transposase, partial [Epsilonproteobacteria bacterium]|nr:IS1634 family transposase [Campylobacterota bacterium]
KSVQIVETKRIGKKVKQTIIKHIGIAFDDKELEELQSLAHSIKVKLELDTQLPIYSPQEIEEKLAKYEKKGEKKEKIQESSTQILDDTPNRADYDVNLLDMIEEDRVVKGIHDIFGKLYDELGFGKVLANPARNVSSCNALKEIVLARVATPDSKRGSVLNLAENFGVKLDLKAVYGMMDKIDDKQISKLNTIVYDQTKALFKDTIDIVYFDATTLYFESFTEDALKKNGYSKDGKFNQPQVVLALMVTKQGLPVGYKAFSGDTFDGHTIIPALKEVQEHFKIDKVVFVADSGMFNKNNLNEFDKIHNPFLYKYTNYTWSTTATKPFTLQSYQHQQREFHKSNITYIVGARIKNMSQDITTQILDMNNYKQLDDNIKVATIEYQGKKLLVTHSLQRASKDKHDREKGIAKLKEKLKKNSSVKSQLSNQGYNKYLKL